MTPADLLHNLTQLGVLVAVDGDRLALDAPKSVLTSDLLDRLRQNKPALLDLLKRRELRREVANTMRAVREKMPDLAVPMRDAWHERLAICVFDGGLTKAQAEEVAALELAALVMATYAPGIITTTESITRDLLTGGAA